MEELKTAAQERGLMVIRKRKTGPIMILESRTGKSFGNFSGVEEAMAAVIKVTVLHVIDAAESVGWSCDVEHIELPRPCPNAWGPSCLCLDTTAIYLCAAPPCRARAACQGACRNHYSQLKVFGDLTELSIAKTATLAENGDFDLETLSNHPKMVSLKIPSPTHTQTTSFSPGEITIVTSGIIGMSIRWTGSEYLLMDKDGNVLDRVTSKAEFFEDDAPEPELVKPTTRRGKKNLDAE